ncbi:hypothetical protein Bbelb_332920 [Branchiostoma belcheri]|nr:hypothetical protein Bbelb_383480 [Branchiostoma belcheri]KAI8489068.1 hypothetical protein Bbelb_332920 [Branchiostoma belcheri]
MRRMLVLLLILLKEAGPTAAHSCDCSWRCWCDNRGLTSVPQDLSTTMDYLNLQNNFITTLNQSDFSRYSSLTRLYLHYNQISVINSGAFYNLSRLTRLDLYNNQLTILRSDMFVGLDNLRYLYLHYNNIHSIEAGTFNATPQLQWLYLNNNQLTILRSDIFVGLESLRTLYLSYNNIHSIEAGTFNGTPQLRELHLQRNNISSIEAGTFNLPGLETLSVSYNWLTILRSDTFVGLDNLRSLYLDHNNITNFPESSSLANISNLRMNHNQMETLSSTAYDILASISTVNIDNNPWQCDCRMLPIKQKMTGFRDFEKQIRCAGPKNVEGKSLLLVVDPEDLICEETGSTDSTTPASFSLSAFLSGFLGGVVGSFLILVIFLAIWCHHRTKTRPAPVPDPSGVSSNPNGAATGPTSGRHHTGQGASPSRAAHSDDGESRPRTSGTVPPPRSLDKSHAVLRAPLPPIKTAGPRGDVRNVPEAAHGDAAANISVPLSRHFIYQQTCPSGLPKGLPGL